jgi:conjugal transfer pilus assembly protein TraD
VSPSPRPRRAPYWTLPLFAGLLTVPFGWGAAALAGVVAGRIAWSLYRERGVSSGHRAALRAGQVALGADPQERPVTLTEDQLSAHALIVGASGSGKSTTLLRILGEQITHGRPVVALDLKGSPSFAADLERAATAAGRPFRLWTLDGPAGWNPLAHGNATELKDKLISSERFSEPHYRRAAERYVQSAIQVLHASGRRADLAGVVALMDPRRLSAVARKLNAPLGERVGDYLESLTPDQLSAVRGLGTRLALLSESSAGPFLSDQAAAGQARPIDLPASLAAGEVVLFSLNSSRYGSLATQVGTLAIQDLISVSGERLEHTGGARAATVALDEFSALGSDHVLALLARGRESGFSVLLATQELSDLERAGRGFRDQVLGLTTVKIAHRQDVPGSARTIAEMAGTKLVWDETRQLRSPLAPAGSRGTLRQVEGFRVHPNVVKTLGPGEAVLLVKSPVARVTLVRVARVEAVGAPIATAGKPAATSPVPAEPIRSQAEPIQTQAEPIQTQAEPIRTPAEATPVAARSRPALPRLAGSTSSPALRPSTRAPGGAGRGDQPPPGVTR